jgi:ferrochelatase
MTNQSKTKQWGILLVNLGTPEAPTPEAVRRYLKEFLWDPRVIELPRPLWWMVLNGVILTTRPRKSAQAYKVIWTNQGSPLLSFSQALTTAVGQALRTKLGNHVVTELAMRYGQPSLRQQLDSLRSAGIERFLVLPLYPQYSSPSTGSAFDALSSVLRNWRYIPEVRFISDYHDHPLYIQAVAQRIEQFWQTQGRSPYLLFSFHGLPDRSRQQGDPYYQQCLTSAKLIAERLSLAENGWQVVFQSRFGLERWLQPYCAEVLRKLPERGVKEVDLVCPGFAVDCLETLEEIGMTNKELFLQAGGHQYRLIPALNDSPEHVETLVQLIIEHLDIVHA